MLLISGCQSHPSLGSGIAAFQEPVKSPLPLICAAEQPKMQTPLWFGLHRADGSPITDKEWQNYINDQVTPRVSEGLSVYHAQG